MSRDARPPKGMPKRTSARAPASTPDSRPPWGVPVAVRDVPETGRHFDLVADENTRAAVAEALGVRALPRLAASFDISRQGRDGLHVAGRVSATVGQTCVVTLEPIENEIDEVVDLVFVPEAAPAVPDEAADTAKLPMMMLRNRWLAAWSISAWS
jgi:hypothetical protein